MSRGADVKQQVMELRARKTAIEAEIAERSARLEAAGVGLKGNLVDREGFPLSGIDIPAVRADRQAVIMLQHDHTALMKTCEQLLHQLHAQAGPPAAAASGVVRPAAPSAAPAAVPATGPSAPADLALVPFAVVDEVSSGSPAAAAGIQLGDQLVRFGGVGTGMPGTLQAVAAELQANEGGQVEALVLRRGRPVPLLLRPQAWPGRGLLGCHLRPK